MSDRRKILITGITGQDGAYLASQLLEKGYEVFGGVRRTSVANVSRLKSLGIGEKIKLVPIELMETGNIIRVLEKIEPDEVYNLAAQSFVGVSFEHPVLTSEVTAIGALRILEAIRTVNKKIKFYQASSSEMYGNTEESPQDEKTHFKPASPYAIAKVFAYWTTVNYRESYGIFACNGILFNHESPLRGEEFITRKISIAVAEHFINPNSNKVLEVGNLDAKRDWGYAPEYTEAMFKMLQKDTPSDYVIATGENHSVREFIEVAYKTIGIDIVWKGKGKDEVGLDKKNNKTLIKVSEAYLRPSDVNYLVGNYSKSKRELGWEPKTRFNELVKIMVNADIENLKNKTKN